MLSLHSTTHALVWFSDEAQYAVIPCHRILNTTIKDGDAIKVIWNNRKQYTATFILSGICNCYSSGAKITLWLLIFVVQNFHNFHNNIAM